MTKLTLAQMLAKQKDSTDADAPAQAQPHPPVDKAGDESQQGTPEASDNLDRLPEAPKNGLAFLKQVAPVANQQSVDAPAATPAKGLGFLAGARIGTPKELQPTPPKASPAPVPAAKAEPTPSPELSGLDALMASTSGASGSLGTASRFADEIPADAPIRELDPAMAEQAKAFIGSLDAVYRALHAPELLGGVVRGIMIELSNHPEYRKLITPMDYHTMVRGMRESMGLARIKKEEAKAKRTPSKKSTVVTDLDALNALEGMDFS